MIRSLIVSPDRVLTAQLKAAIAELTSVSVVRVIDHYADVIELSRAIRAHAAQLVFVTTDSVEHVLAVAESLEQILPGIQVVAVGPSSSPETLMALMRGGIREFLSASFAPEQVAACVARVADNLKRRPVAPKTTNRVYSFLPSKPGVGASTLAVNVSLSLAAQQQEGTLLTDLDLNSGVVRFLLKLETPYGVVDAAQKAAELDENVWSQLVSKSGSLDVLHAGILNPDIRLQSMNLRQLIEYARRHYGAICIDLSGNLERYALEVMHESRGIFLVCTSEPCSLYLAREKVQYLRRMDLGDRISVLLNRCHQRFGLTLNEVESLVGAPVLMSFPNDYARLNRAITEGKAVDPGSGVGKQCAALAAHMLEQKQIAAQPARRRFVEYFALSPARFHLDDHIAGR